MFLLLGILFCAVTATVSAQDKEFVYLQGYEEVSKARVDELRQWDEVFSLMCKESHDKFDRYMCDLAVQQLQALYNGEDVANLLAYSAQYAIKKPILDPLNRAEIYAKFNEKIKAKAKEIKLRNNHNN